MIGPSEPPHPARRVHSNQDPFPLSTNPTAFNTLSSVAMDELYMLEREEAIRRAEYEARHAEALRRATNPHDAKPAVRSKSETTSPVSTPYQSTVSLVGGGGGYFGTSSERDAHGAGEDEYITPKDKIKRRMSGPAWQMTPMSREPAPGHSQTLGHVVDSYMHRGQHGHAHRGHHPSYQTSTLPASHTHQYRYLARQEDTPSPLSSDSDSFPHLTNSPPNAFPAPQHAVHNFGLSDPNARSSESAIAFTPSTSPFLGPLRTLNLHSANPSRAPSPILLPPASMGDGPLSPLEDHPQRRTNSFGSPPGSGVHTRPSVRRKSAPDDRPHLSSLTQTYSYSGQYSQMHTPQLSSGPSSEDSSLGSLSYPLGNNANAGPLHLDTGSGTPSAANSRPSSPLVLGRNDGAGHPHHHHIAHSVRKAFGMTPIHPQPQPPRNTSWTFSHTQSGSSTPAPGIYSSSVPGSRSGSPPITLPPIKIQSALSSPSHRSPGINQVSLDEEESTGRRYLGERERLPGFSEFEAASLASR